MHFPYSRDHFNIAQTSLPVFKYRWYPADEKNNARIPAVKCVPNILL